MEEINVSAILSGYMGEMERSNRRFRMVSDADPMDAFASYYTGQGYAQSGEPEEALVWFKRSMDLDPYLRSAIYDFHETGLISKLVCIAQCFTSTSQPNIPITYFLKL